MIPNMPTVGVRFDVGRMDAGSYAVDAWKAFWQAVDPVTIRGSLLFDGDTDGNVFWIAVQNLDGGLVKHIEAAVSACEDVGKVCAEPLLAKGAEATSQQLESAGSVDPRGSLAGNTGAARSALAEVRPERAAPKPAAPAGAKPVSQLSRGFARSTTIGSHAARAALTGGGFGPPPARASRKAGAARKSSFGRIVLILLVVALVATLVAAMVFAPKPEDMLEDGEPGPASRATTGEAVPEEAAEDVPTEGPTEEDAPAEESVEAEAGAAASSGPLPGTDPAAEDGTAQPADGTGDDSGADAAPE